MSLPSVVLTSRPSSGVAPLSAKRIGLRVEVGASIEHLSRSATNLTPAWIKSLDHRLVSVNAATASLIGVAREDLLGRPLSAFYPLEVAARCDRHDDMARYSVRSVFQIDRIANDRWCLSSKVPVVAGDGSVIAIAGYSRSALALGDLLNAIFDFRESTVMPVAKMATVGAETQPTYAIDQTVPPRWLSRLLAGMPEIDWISARIDQISALVGMTPDYFSRTFRNAVGRTPSEFRRSMQLRLVAKLLLEQAGPLADLAIQSGFSDQSHLTRVFRQVIGLTPSRFQSVFRDLPLG